MSEIPILREIERKKKIAGIIRGCLAPYGLQGHVDENELHIREKCIVETTSQKAGLSKAILDQMFPREPAPSTLYHYTSLEGLKGIATSGELRLFPIRNRLGQGGELKAFAKAHGLQGYLDSAEGQPFYKQLSDDLFYAALTRVPPKDPQLMWEAFARGTGARLELRVEPKAAELRPIRYEQKGARTLLSVINDALTQDGAPPLVPWTLSRIGAFYLASTVRTEDEVRLVMKKYAGGFDPTRSDGKSLYWPIPIGQADDVCRLDVLGIHVAPSGDSKEIEAGIAGTALAAVPVTGP
jgi:hypothetical protein